MEIGKKKNTIGLERMTENFNGLTFKFKIQQKNTRDIYRPKE